MQGSWRQVTEAVRIFFFFFSHKNGKEASYHRSVLVNQAARSVAKEEGEKEDEEVVGVPESLKVLSLCQERERERGGKGRGSQ